MEEAKLVMCINVECNSNGTTNGVRCSTYQQCHGKRKHQGPDMIHSNLQGEKAQKLWGRS